MDNIVREGPFMNACFAPKAGLTSLAIKPACEQDVTTSCTKCLNGGGTGGWVESLIPVFSPSFLSTKPAS